MDLADTKTSSDYGQSFEHPADEGMLYVPGGTYRVGSDRHYPEEAPVHRVSVAEFWMDRTPVTNRQFRKFVNATGYVTFAEIAPEARDYPGALPHMLKAGSLVFTPPKQAVDLRNWGGNGGRSNSALIGAGPMVRAATSAGSTTTRSSTSPTGTPKPMPNGPVRNCRLKPNGNSPHAADWMARNSPGATSNFLAASTWRTPGKAVFRTRILRRMVSNAPRLSPHSRPMATVFTT
jgi:hypothetical protein